MADSLGAVRDDVVVCRRCPRLVAWREEVAANPPARFRGQAYWGRPLPGWGDPESRILIVGLAPAANGGNRTGRIFTGDRSGDFLFASLYRAGLVNQPTSTAADDGLAAFGVYVAAAVRCAPPDNKPLPSERDNCREYLRRELALLPHLRVVVALGAYAWDGVLQAIAELRPDLLPPHRPVFGHGAEVPLGNWTLLGTYHPSQRNTFTGLLTGPMFDRVFDRAKELADLAGPADEDAPRG